MKCPECQRNHPASQGMRCSKCRYEFVFNPKHTPSVGLTDGKFLLAIRRASQNGTTFFTANQLYAAYAKIVAKSRTELIGGVIVLCVVGMLAFGFSWKIFLAAMVGAIGIVLVILFGKPKPMMPHHFNSCITAWKNSGKSIGNLIEVPTLGKRPAQAPEDDIFDYGVERVLIVQRDLLVDLFVNNNQHAEQRMLVIAESSYPDYVVPQLQQVMASRPDLPIYLLHDADTKGTQMRDRIAKLDWLPLRDHPVIDLGYFPDDYKQLKRAEPMRRGYRTDAMPADAMMLGAMAMGLAACFANQCPFGDEIARQASSTWGDGSGGDSTVSFG